jgi:hypothetical protein
MLTSSRGTAQLLINAGANINAQNPTGATSLMMSITADCDMVTKLLIDRGADIRLQDHDGRNALIHAALQGNLEATTLLLQRGANTEATERDGSTPLMSAANILLARTLVTHGAEVEAQNELGLTPLMTTLKWHNFPVAEYLINECSANVNHRDRRGMTPLMHAAITNNTKGFKLLLQHGADLDTQDVQDQDVFHYIKSDAIAELIVPPPLKRRTPSPGPVGHRAMTPLLLPLPMESIEKSIMHKRDSVVPTTQLVLMLERSKTDSHVVTLKGRRTPHHLSCSASTPQIYATNECGKWQAFIAVDRAPAGGMSVRDHSSSAATR